MSMFTEEEVLEERRIAYDQGFSRGTGVARECMHTEAYLDDREQQLAKAPKPGAARAGGDWLGDIEGRSDE